MSPYKRASLRALHRPMDRPSKLKLKLQVPVVLLSTTDSNRNVIKKLSKVVKAYERKLETGVSTPASAACRDIWSL